MQNVLFCNSLSHGNYSHELRKSNTICKTRFLWSTRVKWKSSHSKMLRSVDGVRVAIPFEFEKSICIHGRRYPETRLALKITYSPSCIDFTLKPWLTQTHGYNLTRALSSTKSLQKRMRNDLGIFRILRVQVLFASFVQPRNDCTRKIISFRGSKERCRCSEAPERPRSNALKSKARKPFSQQTWRFNGTESFFSTEEILLRSAWLNNPKQYTA